MASNSIMNKIDIKLCDMEDTINSSLLQLDNRYNQLKELLVYSLKEADNQNLSSDFKAVILAEEQAEETIFRQIESKFTQDKQSITELFNDIDKKIEAIPIKSENISKYKSNFQQYEEGIGRMQAELQSAYNKHTSSISCLENDTYQTLDYIKEILKKYKMKNDEMKDTYANTLSDVEGRSNFEVNETKHLRADFEQNVFSIIEDVYNKLID